MGKTITVELTPQECEFLFKVCKEYKDTVKIKSTMMGTALAGMTGIKPREENKDILLAITNNMSEIVSSAERENLKIAQDLAPIFHRRER